MSDPIIEEVPDNHHYELRTDGELIGHINYRDDGERRVFLHTVVDDAYSGQGLATRMVRFALEDVRAKGRRAVALCPMMAGFVIKHRDYDDVVDPPHVLDSPSLPTARTADAGASSVTGSVGPGSGTG